MARLVVLFAVAFMAMSVLFARSYTAPSSVIAIYRLLCTLVLMSPVVFLKHRNEIKQLPAKLLGKVALGGVFFALNILFYFEALKRTSIVAAVALSCMEVFLVAVIEVVFLKDKITFKGVIGIIIAFVGCMVVTFAQDGGSVPATLEGNVLGILAGVSLAGYTLMSKRCRKEMTTNAYTFVAYCFAALFLLVVTLCSGVSVVGYQANDWLCALGMAVFCTILGHSLVSWSLKTVKASFVSATKMLIPAFSSFYGWVFLNEIPGLQAVVGAAVILVGIVLYASQCNDETPSLPQQKHSA